MTRVITFYKFVPLAHYHELRQPLLNYCTRQGVKGTLLLAPEGINGTLAGTPEALEATLNRLRQEPLLADLAVKEAQAAAMPFGKMKVKLKPELVPLGHPEINPGDRVGQYVPPEHWNQLITAPDVTVIDTRNTYEVGIGTFQGAQNPGTESFREFPAYVAQHLDPDQHPKVALFCTGGIRCEKATAYLLQQGFEEVYHLRGGILNYLQTVPETDSLWQGECFVFDDRVAVTHDLAAGHYRICQGCGHPLSASELASDPYEPGITCPHCYADLTPEKRRRLLEKQRQRRQPGQPAQSSDP